jgi:hypothetical protein
MPPLNLVALRETLAICKLPAHAVIPSWATRGSFNCVTRTPDELSIVCPEEDLPMDLISERGWRCLRVATQLDFSLVGILALLLHPIARAGIPIFVISTFDTDYLLVKSDQLERVAKILREAGHCVT